jgi:hypothetical protein
VSPDEGSLVVGKSESPCLPLQPYGEDVFGLRAIGGDKNGLGLTYPAEQPEGKTQQLQIYCE